MNDKCGYLHLILGPMFAGKSTKLLNVINNLKENNNNFLVIKNIIDTRYNSNTNNIVTHDNQIINCIGLTNLLDIIHDEKYITNKYILIDEGQFFNDIYKFIEIAIENDNKHIIITGLNGDSNRKPFLNISKLISLADKVEILESKCSFCDNKGIFTLRKNNKQKKILVGDETIYKLVCRNHFLQYNK
jgi:thymidine kinase